jgi:DNA-binding CsgD family transcriptional regulator
LTPRQQEVLVLAAQGLNRPQIAEQLGLRLYTVGTHLKMIHRKLGLHNRAAVVAFALRMGLAGSPLGITDSTTNLGTQPGFCSCCGAALDLVGRQTI